MAQAFRFHQAGSEDLETLLALRLETLRAANQLPEGTPLPEVEEHSRAYFQQSFAVDQQVTYIAYAGEEIAGGGSVCFYQVLPTCDNPSGRKAYLMNMYTRPAYRRRGLARQLLDRLTAAAEQRGIQQITLEATAMGRPLYESYGFAAMPAEMQLQK